VSMDPSQPRDPAAPETGEAPAAPPPQESWQSQPQQPAPPPPAAGAPAASQPAWMSNLTDQTPVAGPAGFFYADVPNRVIAMIIDVVAIIIVYVIVGIVTVALLGTDTIIGAVANPTALLVQNILSYVLWAAYFMYTWVAMRGTLGMRLLGLQIGHEQDGRNLNYTQAAYRFGVLFGPQIVIGILAALVPALGALGLLGFVWLIYVLYTMAQSPTKQGIHDRYANSMVVKAGRAVA